MVTRPMARPVSRDGTLTADIVGALGLAGPPAVAIIAFALAWATLMPGVGYWDTAEFQAVPPLLGTLHPTGFPAYAILGWLGSVVLQPFGDAAYRMNLLSALYVAGAAAVTVVLVRQLTGRRAIAIAAGLAMFLTPIAWRIATHADAHALHLLLLGLVFALLLAWESRARDEDGPRAGADRWLIAAAAAYGVAVANHTVAVLAAPGIGLFVLAVEPEIFLRRGLIARCIGVGVGVAALLYLELPLRAGPFRAPLVYGHPETLSGLAYVMFGQQFGGDLGAPVRSLGPRLGGLADFAADQLGLLAAFVPLAALSVVARRWRYALLTAPTLVITCSFAVLYDNAEITRYYLGPLLIVVTWLAILADGALGLVVAGLTRIRERVRGAGSRSTLAVLVVEVAFAVAFVAPAGIAAGATRREVDESRDIGAQQWIDRTFAELPPNALVISWWSFSTPLWYARDVEGRRSDITIIDDRTILDENLGAVPDVIDRYLGARPVYVIRLQADMDTLAERYELRPLPDLYPANLALVVGRRAVTP
jgi:Protein of unknown function (DUF2723)